MAREWSSITTVSQGLTCFPFASTIWRFRSVWSTCQIAFGRSARSLDQLVLVAIRDRAVMGRRDETGIELPH